MERLRVDVPRLATVTQAAIVAGASRASRCSTTTANWGTPGPSGRARHQVSDTPEVARALDLAGKPWPDEPRSKPLLRLINLGGGLHDQRVNADAHRAAVPTAAAGTPEAFEAGYLTELRQHWPA